MTEKINIEAKDNSFLFFLYLCRMNLKFLFLLFFLPLCCTAQKLRPLVWVLDAGHGGKDVGCETRNYQEKDITLDITKRVAELLRKNKPGIKVILTRKSDVYVSLEKRCQIANNANADLFLSIHVNAVEHNRLLSGTETFFAYTRAISDAVLLSAQGRNVGKSELLARLLQKNYHEAGRTTSRGAKPENLYVCNNTMMPAALTEVGFISNREDEAYMTSERGKKEIALCIYNALIEYYVTTQAKTHRKTLVRLRHTNDKSSGLNVKKLTDKTLEASAPKKKQTQPKEEPKKPEVKLDTVVSAPQSQPELLVESQVLADSTQQETITPKDSSLVFTEEQQAAMDEPIQPEKGYSNSPSIPVFSIQIVAVSAELKLDDERLKGLSPVTFVKSGNMYKGLYGGTTQYKKARETLAAIREKFPDAFIVAYLGEEPITTARALEISGQ